MNLAYFLFLVWSNDNGSTYSNNASGPDASYTQPDRTRTWSKRSTAIVIATASFRVLLPSRSALLPGRGPALLPQKWAIVVKNGSGATAKSTGNVLSYQGVNMQGV